MKEIVTFTNMCMIYDDDGNVIVQNRRDEKWSGVSFPGGHVEKSEDFTDAVIREVFEETGLIIQSPQLCGIKHFYLEDESRYVVLCYKAKHVSGDLTSSDEGDVCWIKLEKMKEMKLARGMEYMLQLFLNDDISEYCIRSEGGKWVDILK